MAIHFSILFATLWALMLTILGAALSIIVIALLFLKRGPFVKQQELYQPEGALFLK